MRAISKKRSSALIYQGRIRAEVFERDGGCILAGRGLLGPCGGAPMTPHHLLKASQGGRYEYANLVTLCARHNTAVEDHPNEAHALGLVVRHGETVADADAAMAAWRGDVRAVLAGLDAWYNEGAAT